MGGPTAVAGGEKNAYGVSKGSPTPDYVPRRAGDVELFPRMKEKSVLCPAGGGKGKGQKRL